MFSHSIKKIVGALLLSLIASFTYAANEFTEKPAVQQFIHHMVTKYHFKRKELVDVFAQVQPRPTVMSSIKAPLEQKPWSTYQLLFVTEWRIRQGVEFWNKYKEALARAEKKYGVPASIIVATIGVETKYGKNTGEHRVIDALTNIAFSESPRAPYFKKELEQYFLLCREEHIDPLSLKGSYAGAIGQPQFMPSSYRNYAVKYEGKGKIDLNNNQLDVIASIANYYKKHGWQSHAPVAIPTTSHESRYPNLTGNYHIPTLSKSQLSHYKKPNVIELQGYFGKEYWLGFSNFDVIKRYNPSDLYAMAVYQLSLYISKLRDEESNRV